MTGDLNFTVNMDAAKCSAWASRRYVQFGTAHHCIRFWATPEVLRDMLERALRDLDRVGER